jgi:hypothetical protein
MKKELTRIIIMLWLCVALILILSLGAKCQMVVGMGAGYTSAKAPVFNLQLGFKTGHSLIYYNQVNHVTRKATAPQILGIRYGYNIGSFQPNAGADYHLLSNDKAASAIPDQRWHFAFGITKYFESIPLKIDAGISGKYLIASIGLYKILD